MAYLPAGAEDYDGGWEMALEDYQARLLDLDILVDADPEYDDLFDDFEDFSDNDLSFDWDDMEEDEDNEIYTCVQDAPILLPQLRFYQDPDDTSKRWPRIRTDMKGHLRMESYESVHRVLEELELLLKAWKRRTSHPFTAHLQRKKKEELDTTQDFSDMESDDPEVPFVAMLNQPQISENLTKKKYCQSTRLFFEIFDSDMEMDQTINLVKKVRKFVHNVAFEQFLSVFDEDSIFKLLPTELREKIWQLTQTPYMDDGVFCAGLRLQNDERLVENERILDLFGVAGNLLMLVFEFMFQRLSLRPKDFVFVTSSNVRVSCARSLFRKYRSLLRRAFVKLKSMSEEPREEASDAITKLDRGLFTLGMGSKEWPPEKCLAVVTDKNPSPYFATLQMTTKGESPQITIRVTHAKTDKAVAFINTTVSALSFYSTNVSPCVATTLFGNKLTLVQFPGLSADDQRVEFHEWTFEESDGKGKPQQLKASHARMYRSEGRREDRMQACQTGYLDDVGLIQLLYKEEEGQKATVNVIDSQTGDIIDKLIWEVGSIALHVVKKDLLVMRHLLKPSFLIIDLNTRSELMCVEPICPSEMCHHEICFDTSKAQFVVLCFHLRFKAFKYQLLKDGTFSSQVISEGSIGETYGEVNLKSILYWNDILLTIQNRSIDYKQHNIFNDLFMAVMALDFNRKTEVPLANIGNQAMVRDKSYELLDRHVDSFAINDGQFLTALDENTVVFGGRKRYTLTLMASEAECLKQECERAKRNAEKVEKEKKDWNNLQTTRKAEYAQQKVRDAERAALFNAAKEKFVDKEERIQGKIHSWKVKKGYGFVQPMGEAEPLGSMFVHISNVVNAGRGKYPGNGRWIEFSAVHDPGKTNFRAVEARLIDKKRS